VEVGNISATHLEHHVNVTRYAVLLEHFRLASGEGADPFVFLLVVTPGRYGNLDERRHLETERRRIEIHLIAPHDPPRLQFPDPLLDGLAGEPNGAADLGVRRAGIVLQKTQDRAIYFVEIEAHTWCAPPDSDGIRAHISPIVPESATARGTFGV